MSNPTPRSTDASAANPTAAWQARYFDDRVRADPSGAFGRGALQQELWRKRIDMTLRYAQGGGILELGCGNGLVARAVAERTSAQVTAIDVSGECVAFAQTHNAHPRVQYVQASIETFSPACTVDLVTMYEVLEHVADPSEVLRAARGWLRPGGHLILSTPNRSSLNRRVKRLPLVRGIYARLAGEEAEATHPGHVEEYHYEYLIEMLVDAGLEIVEEDGVILLLPFPGMISSLARSPRFARVNVASGRWRPRLALHAYVAVRRPVGVGSS